QVQSLSALIWEFQLKGFKVAASAAGRLIDKKNGRTATKTSLEQAVKKIGINALDSVADNLKAYDNDYQQFERKDGQMFRRGDTVAFLSYTTRVQCFAARRGTVSLLVPFKDFYIEVDPRKLTPVSPQATEPVQPVPSP